MNRLAFFLVFPWAIQVSTPMAYVSYKGDLIATTGCHLGLSKDDCDWQKDFIDAMNEAHQVREAFQPPPKEQTYEQKYYGTPNAITDDQGEIYK